ncbi:MAG: hypothetical protein K0R94_1482 [Burkholderiales bacterium]|jgi:hypothetical protein|nr:hypothetical protein [Burkholderiales bacterium]
MNKLNFKKTFLYFIREDSDSKRIIDTLNTLSKHITDITKPSQINKVIKNILDYT